MSRSAHSLPRQIPNLVHHVVKVVEEEYLSPTILAVRSPVVPEAAEAQLELVEEV